jgi:dUTP pyrophosphatase
MNTNEIEEYLKKLKEFEKDLSTGNVDDDFVNQLNKLMGSLSNDISSEVSGINSELEKFGVKVPSLLVNIKKLHPNAVIPSYSKDGDAGMDLTITREIENTSFSVSYGFGIAMEIPKGYVGLVFPRSSVRNQDLLLSNCVGVIDSGYRGEIQATFKKTNGLDSLKYNVGDRGAQIMILPYPQVKMNEVTELSNTERGDGGFGSTGV